MCIINMIIIFLVVGTACIIMLVAWLAFVRLTNVEREVSSLRSEMRAEYATLHDVYAVQEGEDAKKMD